MENQDNQNPQNMPENVRENPKPLIGLTGGTGYVGGRLLSLLEARGHRLRCLARRPERLQDRVGPTTEVIRADVLDRQSLGPALDGLEVAYYLVHNMGDSDDFEEKDREGALNFAAAARKSSLQRIIYLGGLGDPATGLSAHLRSRQEVGRILREESDTQVIELRASIIIGSGSLSFELIRALVERLPVMICPRWVSTPTQPIAIEDVLEYLIAAIDLPGTESRIIEIGGPDRVSYGDLMQEYAKQRGLRRRIISVPVLTPYLSSLWLGLVTPIYARIGQKLIDGLRHPTVVRDPAARELFSIEPRGLAEAIRRAIEHEDHEMAETRWFDAVSAGVRPPHWGGRHFGSRIVDTRVTEVDLSPEEAFEPIQEIGGEKGWYFGDWLWNLRGAMDIILGGVGMRRGRRDPVRVNVGDPIDCWRVESIEPGKKLRLAAEMRLPGRAWLEFEVSEKSEEKVTQEPQHQGKTPEHEGIPPQEIQPGHHEKPKTVYERDLPDGAKLHEEHLHPEAYRAHDKPVVEPPSSDATTTTEPQKKTTTESYKPHEPRKKTHTQIRQTAIFDPLGIGGRLYWYALYPLHKMVFSGMLKGIARAAQKREFNRRSL